MSLNDFDANASPFLSHLIELRDRLLKAILAVLLVFLPLSFYANDIYSFLANPLLKHLPEHSTMIAIDVASPFFTPFKLALVVAVFISIPVILYQFWAFVAPAMPRAFRRASLIWFLFALFTFGSSVRSSRMSYRTPLPTNDFLIPGKLSTAR